MLRFRGIKSDTYFKPINMSNENLESLDDHSLLDIATVMMRWPSDYTKEEHDMMSIELKNRR